MSKWETVALGEVAEIVSGATPKSTRKDYWGGPIHWATPADLSKLNSVEIHSTERTITATGLQSTSARLLPVDSVLLSSRAPIGHVAINKAPMATNQGFKSLIPSKALTPCFLYRWLEANRDYLQSIGTGATFKEISKTIVAKIQIPLPSIPEQHRIASILDDSDAIRRRRRAQLAHLDDLPQALFHEIFAGRKDPVIKLGEVVPSIDNGVSLVAETRRASDNEWGILKLGAVTYGTYRPEENKAFRGDPSRISPHEVHDGDLLVTRKNTIELVGAAALVRGTPPQLALPDLIFRLNIDREKLNNSFMQALLMSPPVRQRVRGLAGGSAASMSNISKKRLSNLPIPVPPLELQCRYADKLSAIHTERDRVARALEADNELFAALQHRAFRGEL